MALVATRPNDAMAKKNSNELGILSNSDGQVMLISINPPLGGIPDSVVIKHNKLNGTAVVESKKGWIIGTLPLSGPDSIKTIKEGKEYYFGLAISRMPIRQSPLEVKYETV